jgi:hypothetical protein
VRIAGWQMSPDSMVSHAMLLGRECPVCFPTCVKKTSVDLEEMDRERLRHMATREGCSQAEVVRAALAAYEAQLSGDRRCALTGAWEDDGTSVADLAEDVGFLSYWRRAADDSPSSHSYWRWPTSEPELLAPT